jgi:uncharacterized protein (DUF2164 family)
MMNKENTEAQVKAQLIHGIKLYKQEALNLGFDYPTESVEDLDIGTLISFYTEIVDYVAYNHGFNAAIHGEDWIPTH